jgi:hypothetical protein
MERTNRRSDRAPWRESDDLHAGALKRITELCRIERISVESEVAFPQQESIVDVKQSIPHPIPHLCVTEPDAP